MHEICLVAAPTPPRGSESRSCYVPPRAGVPAPLATAAVWEGGHESHVQRVQRSVRHLARVRGLRYAAALVGDVRKGLDAGQRQVLLRQEACVVAYNKRKVEEHERLLETLEEEEDRAKVAPPAVLEVT